MRHEDSVKGISRRDLIKLGSIGAVGIASTGILGGCASPTATQESNSQGEPSSSDWQGEAPVIPAEEIEETIDCDVVVIGAGAAGTCAALSANDAGAKVVVVQKEATARSQGNGGSGIDLTKNDPDDIPEMLSELCEKQLFRNDRTLSEAWALNSGETVQWLFEKATLANAQVALNDIPYMTESGKNILFTSPYFGPKPYTVGSAMQDLAKLGAEEGVEYYYETPAIVLVEEGDRIAGVVCKNAEGSYIRFNAAKGVIIATGDYTNDEEMMEHFAPENLAFWRKQANSTGDGHRMGVWVGGEVEPAPHTKTLHDYDAGPMTDFPFLYVDNEGKRFCCETARMHEVGNYLRFGENAGWYTQVFDDDYEAQVTAWGGTPVAKDKLPNYMPDVDSEKTGVFPSLINTHQADTLEELAEKLEIPASDFVETVARYNELVAAGHDADYGKPVQYMKPIVTPPFYGIHRHLGISAMGNGLYVNVNQQVLRGRGGDPIPGLYAAGNTSGPFNGALDNPMEFPGMNLGRCYTGGRIAGLHVAGA